MVNYNNKIVGYFAYSLDNEVFCSNSACVITSNEVSIQDMIGNQAEDKKFYTKKTKFKEVLSGLKQGGEYAFDEESFDILNNIILKNEIPPLRDRERRSRGRVDRSRPAI
jgi:hypothetical protein